MYDQGSDFIGNEFIKPLIEEAYGITAKPITSGNPMYNGVLERIHQIIGNLGHTFNISQTYTDKNGLWTGILAAAAFAIRSTTNIQKGYIFQAN